MRLIGGGLAEVGGGGTEPGGGVVTQIGDARAADCSLSGML